MEEVKRESAKEEMCACQRATAACGSNHRYCFKRCCMLRCVALVLVLGAVFAAGVCAGGEGRHDRGEYGRHGSYRGQMMVHGGVWGETGMMGGQNYQYVNPSGGRVIMMQRTVGATPTIVTATTSTTK